MASDSKYAMELFGNVDSSALQLLGGIIEGGMNQMPTAQVEFAADDKLLQLGDFVGQPLGFRIIGADGLEQVFSGTCISAEFKGFPSGRAHYWAEIKPWLYFLTRSRNNRIFQEKTAVAIVQDVLAEYGFSGYLQLDNSATLATREYCVQYRETDLDFIKRLLEEEGIYFYFTYTDAGPRMVLAEGATSHDPVEGDMHLPFRDDEAEQQLEHIYRWESVEKAVTGKVTLDDYDFERPRADLTVTSANAKGNHSFNNLEVYTYPGRYRTTEEGQHFVNGLMDAAEAGHQTWIGEGNVFNLRPGHVFELIDHPRHSSSALATFMITKARQVFRLEAEGTGKVVSLLEQVHDFGLRAFEHSKITFEAVLKSNIFRMPAITPRPQISGVQTAVVTGPSGEEIHTDSYGRIKVQFHWDRLGERNENTTCWLRTMMPWAGKNWGMIAIPRIGQEVVVQFEEGDPDRPLCVGMLYNADNMPPYALPANHTRSGIKTNSSKGGDGFNELMFEDKKGHEIVWLGAEKDFYQMTQNSAHIKVGYTYSTMPTAAAAQDERSMKLEVENHLDEIIEKGDHSFTIQTGSQTIDIKTDKTETITGKATQTVTGNVTETVKQGNFTETIDTGNHTTTVKSGNIKVKASAGKIDIEAMQKITLKCGGSKIEMTPTEIKLTSMNIKSDAKMAYEAKGGLTAKLEGGLKADVKGGLTAEVNGGAMLTLKGGITMIN